MDVGIGLPNAVPDVDRDSLVEFARTRGSASTAIRSPRASPPARTWCRTTCRFESVGCDELILFPASKDPAQVDLLADAAGLGH